MNIYQKINAIRKTWAETEVNKEGKGKLGGAGRFDYYKPQQIIDFCLAQELKHNLFSNFYVVADFCYYELKNLDNLEESIRISCPFEIPKKMVVNEAQQAGAALTYFNRRLAMMMYKIEDNSNENVDVMANADYTKTVSDIPAPEIPAPPVAPAPPIQDVKLEPPSVPVNESKIVNEQIIIEPPKPPVNDNVVAENVQIEQTPPPASKMGSIESLY